jgi:cysteinyl-tRNA synthetase
MSKKTTHYRNLFDVKKISNLGNSSVQGKLIKFRYNSKNAFDKEPVVLITKSPKGKIEGFNINYLKKTQVVDLLTEKSMKNIGNFNMVKHAFRTYKLNNVRGSITEVIYKSDRQIKKEKLEELQKTAKQKAKEVLEEKAEKRENK